MPIYLVAYISGKQYKVATGVKVLPFQWDKSRQMAIVSNIFNEIDNYNNTIVNEKLTAMREQFSNYLDYLCTHQENATDLFRQTFYKSMAKNENSTISAKDAIKIINSAFDYYYKYINPTAEESTKTSRGRNLNKFIKYVGTMDKVIIKELLSQRSLNDFRDHLINTGSSAGTANAAGEIIKMLINKVIAVSTDFLCYGVAPVQWNKVKDIRLEEDKNSNFPLYDDDIKAIKDCKTLDEREQEYRTMFLLQCETGLRFSDLLRFMRGEYTAHKNGYYYIKTKKNKVEAMIRDCDEIKNLLSQVAEFKCIDVATYSEKSNDKYNDRLKTIAKKSGLNRIITGKDAKGKEYAKPIHELITSHCARYTFVRNMCISGVPKDKVILMTGHTDTNMIDKVYLRYSEEDKANILDDAFAEIKQTTNKESETEGKPVSIKDIKEVLFAFSDIKLINSISSPRLRKINNTIFGIEREKECLAVFNNASESERAQFIEDVKSINQLYYELERATTRPYYKAYQEKMKLFGVTIEPDNYAAANRFLRKFNRDFKRNK